MIRNYSYPKRTSCFHSSLNEEIINLEKCCYIRRYGKKIKFYTKPNEFFPTTVIFFTEVDAIREIENIKTILKGKK